MQQHNSINKDAMAIQTTSCIHTNKIYHLRQFWMLATAARVHQMTKVCHHCIPLYLFIGSKKTAVLQCLQSLLRISASWSMIIVLQFSNLGLSACTHCRHKQHQAQRTEQYFRIKGVNCVLLHDHKR